MRMEGTTFDELWLRVGAGAVNLYCHQVGGRLPWDSKHTQYPAWHRPDAHMYHHLCQAAAQLPRCALLPAGLRDPLHALYPSQPPDRLTPPRLLCASRGVQGGCEHAVVFQDVRLHDPEADPPLLSQYPFQLQPPTAQPRDCEVRPRCAALQCAALQLSRRAGRMCGVLGGEGALVTCPGCLPHCSPRLFV